MRSRVQGELANSYQRNTDFNPDGSQSSTTLFLSASKANGSRNAIDDVVTPRFNVLKSQGRIVMNSMLLVKDRRVTSQDVLTFGPHPSWGTRVVEGTLACQWSNPPVVPAWFDSRVMNAKSSTLIKAHAKIEKEGFQGLVSLAEARKTVSLLRNPFSRSLELITRVKARATSLSSDAVKRSKKEGASVRRQQQLVSDAFESAWLETRFGWRPVIYDIKAAFDAYMNRNWAQDTMPVRKVVRSSEVVEWSSGHESYTSAPTGLTSVKMVAQYDRSSKVSSGVLYEIADESHDDALRQLTGLRLSDVPSALWELTAYSFVVDRFAQVGTWLSAITPKPGVKVLGSWTTVVDRERNHHRMMEAIVAVATPPATVYTQQGGRYEEEIHRVSRSANPLLPILPPLNDGGLSWWQHLDHLALITAGLKGLHKPNRS